MTNPNTPRPIGDHHPVVVVLHHDGYIEVFGDDSIDAQVAVMPHMPTQEGEVLAERYLTKQLPRRHRTVYFPGMLRATGQVETLRPTDINRRKTGLAFLQCVDQLQSQAMQEASK